MLKGFPKFPNAEIVGEEIALNKPVIHVFFKSVLPLVHFLNSPVKISRVAYDIAD